MSGGMFRHPHDRIQHIAQTLIREAEFHRNGRTEIKILTTTATTAQHRQFLDMGRPVAGSICAGVAPQLARCGNAFGSTTKSS